MGGIKLSVKGCFTGVFDVLVERFEPFRGHGQAAIGAADPWGSVNYSNGGLSMGGYVGGKTSLGKTTALSIMGVFSPLYNQVPLFRSGAVNTVVGNGVMAPGQKAITNE